MMDRFKQAQRQKVAERVLESEQADAVLSILTTAETRLLDAVAEQHQHLDVEDPVERVPDPDDRADAIREMAIAWVEDRFAAHWVERYSGLDNAAEAAEFADMSREEWETTKAEWAARYRRNGADGSDDDLAGAHVAARYGVDLETFEQRVVEWPDDRKSDTVRDIMAGGIERALRGIEASTAAISDDQEGSSDE